jgi:hypothetical protein
MSDLAAQLANARRLGVQARDAAEVTAAWRAHGQHLRPVARLSLLRLDTLRVRDLPPGDPRVAVSGDLPLLRSWFELFQERHPDDPSHVGFVVDHPLENGGILLWELDGQPVAMASRTPEVAGMTRMGLAFQPTDGTAYADAAFDACCTAAARTADHVLVLAGTPEASAAYGHLGFTPVLDRVVLEAVDVRA